MKTESTVGSRIEKLRDQIGGGVVAAMATPLMQDGRQINEDALRDLVEFLIDAGLKGLFVGGTTGEGILLSLESRMRLHKKTMEIVDGRVPVLIHVGANTTDKSLELAEHARTIDAHALVAVTPFFYPIHDPALLAYYQAIAGAAPDLPLFAYDIPQMAVNTVSPDLLTSLAGNIPSFAGVKSSNADAQQIRRLVDAASGRSLVLAGNERIALGSLAMGVDGLISGLSTAVPEPFVSMSDYFSAGDMDLAKEAYWRINRILDLIPPGERIGTIKSILRQRGIRVGPAVPPRPMPAESGKIWGDIRKLLESVH